MYKIGIDDQKPDSWVLHQGFCSDVDFCIWVLEVDGLQVPDFDKHHSGNGVLRASGMDAESWQFWVKRVVLLSDQRLNWRVENSQTEFSTTLASMESATSEVSMRYPQLNIPSVDNPALVGATRNYIVWKEQHYQQAAAPARLVYKESEYPTWCPLQPPELWHGDSRVRELLQELWQQYFHTVFSIREEEFVLRQPRLSRTSGIGLYDLLKPYHTKLAALELYLVAYPFSVEYLIAPVSVVLSVADGPNGSDSLTESVLRAAEGLVALNNI